ncbi:C40 family peptidase [Hamadaea tsunoensis]|uniref:C40 family peptidase n=1 Tax=Hamadaea tsunoensis TaxID=53368 RepID=UPI000405F5EA|nr:C40 family peptidase [Hamadaea tsunoensis]
MRVRTLLTEHRNRTLVVAAGVAIAAAVGIPALAAQPTPTSLPEYASSAALLPSDVSQGALVTASATPSASLSPSATASASASATAPKPAATTPKPAAAKPKAATTSATVQAKLATVLREAAKQAGKPYVWAATGPDSFDCAGLTQWVYAKLGIHLDDYVPSQLDKAKVVARSKARPGDLLFFMDGDFAYHVGIFAGNNKMWDAPTEGQTVGLHTIWSDSYLVGQLF